MYAVSVENGTVYMYMYIPTRGSSFFFGKMIALGVLCQLALCCLYDLLASFLPSFCSSHYLRHLFPPTCISPKLHFLLYTCSYTYSTSVVEGASRVTLEKALCKQLHNAVDLLGLAGEVETVQERPV